MAFPYKQNPGEPGDKSRPGLVLSVSALVEPKTGNQYATMQVAYGTSQEPPNFVLDVFHIHNWDALNRAGLCKDTYFCLEDVHQLMWCEEFFPMIQEFGTAIMGSLPQEYILMLKNQKTIRDELKRKGLNWKDIDTTRLR